MTVAAPGRLTACGAAGWRVSRPSRRTRPMVRGRPLSGG